ncbi:MAG: hypothetical protein ACFFD6_06645, partial [Candidatus Thorarchaeota archaeon]
MPTRRVRLSRLSFPVTYEPSKLTVSILLPILFIRFNTVQASPLNIRRLVTQLPVTGRITEEEN